MKRWHALYIGAPLCFALAGCGGGGGGGAPPGTLTVSTQTLTFSSTGTANTPAGQVVTGTITGFPGPIVIKIVSTGPAVGSITPVIAAPNTAQATVFPASAAALGAGSFTSTITVTACTPDVNCSGGTIAAPQTISVTYNIPGVTSSPGSFDYSIGNAPVPEDLARVTTVTGFFAQSWTAAANVPWLSVAPASAGAASPAQLTVSLVQNEIDPLSNGTRSAGITITPSSGSPLTIPVTLTTSRTQVSYVSPYVGISGVSAKAVVRGSKFTEATINGVKFGATTVACPSADCSLTSDTQIDVTYPALAAGTYPLQIQNAQGFNRSFANLVVVDAPAFAATTLTYPNSLLTPVRIFSLAYDAERKALAVGTDHGLIRFLHTSDWQAPVIAGTQAIDAALTADGKQWLTVDTGSGVTPFDAATLAAGTRTDAPSSLFGGNSIRKLVVTNDGKTLLATTDNGSSFAYLYDTPSPALASVSPFSRLQGTGQFPQKLFDANPGVSGNGALVALLQSRLVTAQPVFKYAASNGLLSATSLDMDGVFPNAVGPGPVLDRNGLRIALLESDAPNQFSVLAVHVYDQNFSQLGALPSTTVGVVLRPDPLGPATRAYTLDVFSTCRVRAFDLTSVVSGSFAEITTAPYPMTVACPSNAAFTYPRMTTTADGGTVFIADGQGIRVVPVP